MQECFLVGQIKYPVSGMSVKNLQEKVQQTKDKTNFSEQTSAFSSKWFRDFLS